MSNHYFFRGSADSSGIVIQPAHPPCDCSNSYLSVIENDKKYPFNRESCFKTSWSETFIEKPFLLPNEHWRGPGMYTLLLAFRTQMRFHDSVKNVFAFQKQNADGTVYFPQGSHELYLTDVRVYTYSPISVELNEHIFSREEAVEYGIDYILEKEPEPPDVLFDYKSSDLSGQSSLVNEWVYSTSWVNGVPQNTISKFSQATTSKQPENIQQLIRYDQGLPIKSAVSFEVDDHLRGDNLIHGSNNDLNFTATGKTKSLFYGQNDFRQLKDDEIINLFFKDLKTNLLEI